MVKYLYQQKGNPPSTERQHHDEHRTRDHRHRDPRRGSRDDAAHDPQVPSQHHPEGIAAGEGLPLGDREEGHRFAQEAVRLLHRPGRRRRITNLYRGPHTGGSYRGVYRGPYMGGYHCSLDISSKKVVRYILVEGSHLPPRFGVGNICA
jgi:hypothetical protein